jgi:hypothetical protein
MGSRSARKFYGAAGHRTLKAVQDLKPPYCLDASYRSTSSWRRLHPFCRFATFPPTGGTHLRCCYLHREPHTQNSATHLLHTNQQRRSRVPLPLGEVARSAATRRRGGLAVAQALNFQPLPPSVQHVQNPCALFDTFSTLSLDTMRKNMIKCCCHNAKSPS